MDREKFVATFMGCWMVFNTDKVPNDFMIDAYHNVLREYSEEEINIAFSMAIKTLKFFPKPVELIELISGPTEDLESRAVIQANEVLNTIKRVGGGQSVKFADPVTNAVVRQTFGGWVQLCSELLIDQEKWFLKDFAAAYRAFKKGNITDTEHLPGQIELHNGARGFAFPEPKLIGETSERKLLK